MKYDWLAKQWIKDNPEMWQFISLKALEAMHSGRKFGVKALVEQTRWEFKHARRVVDYKINNNYTSYFARKLIRQYPKIRALIECRRVAA